MKQFYLGVDGGGTFCRARLVNETGEILGEAVGGSGNPRTGIESAWQNILGACFEACKQGHIQIDDYANISVGLGLAGVNQPFEQELILSQHSPFGRRYLLTDAHAACLGAFEGNNGGLLILGTGSCGVVYIDEQFDVVGGWGFPLSDQGSGARIGLSALEYSLAALSGVIPPSELTNAINTEFGHKPEHYVQFQNQSPQPKEFGVFAIRVFEFAESRDPIALKIISEQVQWVAQYLTCLINKGAQDIVLAGGVSTAISPYLPQELQGYLRPAIGDAMDGAIRMAKQKIGRSSL
ncbi:BadF/BadG/BcrA/BcrD ATPase family protein [Marinomonas mediterranea]|uniref:BadF/BadG/BcrA/BcrD ATPase family protein n=1 Tax=Marinomonas mediterranea TaxID=119864 RepID=UPI002349DB05|nr:BadF/BadG/BcrA/BcrD ATPase family protein [Marinomonas mediterranea]WCN08686.1 N-acetylglucosamine kinase [Marinomonas mediterranea]